MRGTGIGIGAAYMKHLRLRDVAVIPTLVVEWMRCISWRRLVTLQHGSGLVRLACFCQGMGLSFRYHIDLQRRAYLPQYPDSPPPKSAQRASIVGSTPRTEGE
jgi:hypothetical protein